MAEIREVVQGIPGASVEVGQEDGGPPTDPPVNIEIVGDNFESLAAVATELKNFLDTNRIEGVENLQMDVDLENPEITINVDECNELWICVEDNGVGFEPAAISSSEDSHSKFGLLSIRERMELLGGECEISSTPGAGTLAILRLPLSQNAVGAVAATHPFSSNVHTIASGHSGRLALG